MHVQVRQLMNTPAEIMTNLRTYMQMLENFQECSYVILQELGEMLYARDEMICRIKN